MAHLLLTIAYVACGKLSLMLALPPGYSSPIFPPAGIAVAAALIGGRKTLPWIFVGSLLLNLWINYSASQQINIIGLMMAVTIAIASMLQAFIGGWALRRVIGYPVSLDQSSELLRFLLLTPVICLTSATLSVSGLLAFDMIERSDFAANWAFWWGGDTFGVMVVLPLVMIVAGEPRALWQSRTYTVALPMLLVFAVFVGIFIKANKWEYNDSLTDFRQLSQQALNQVQNKLEEQESLLEQSVGLQIHDINGQVTRNEFHRFVQKSLIRFSMIQALEWAPGVEGTHRAHFEAAQRNNFPDFEIRERNAVGQLQRAGERNTYYPVTFVEPFVGNEPAVGFDLASNSVRSEAVTKALQSGELVTTPPVHLVQERQHQEGILLLLAVNPHNTQTGVVLTVLRMGDFMDKLLLNTRPLLFTRLIDIDGQNTLYDNFVPENTHVLQVHTFVFGTRHYLLETAPTPAYLRLHHGWQSWSVLAGGILGSSLLGSLLLVGTGYTARIEAQVEDRTRKLKETDSKYHLVVDNVKEVIFMTDAQGLWTFLNKAWEEVTGFNVNESLGQLFLNYIHPEDRQRNLELFEPLIQRKKDYYRHEIRYLTKDGGFRWIEVYARLGLNEQNDIIGTYGTLLDITERRKHEAERKKDEIALQESEARLRIMLENEVVGIVTSKDRIIQWANPAYEKLLGYENGELNGLPSRVIFTNDDTYQSLGKKAYPVINAGNVYRTELEYRCKDGSHITVDVSGGLLPESGETIWTCVDITERKRAETELRIAATAFESQEGMAITDASGSILRVNRAFSNITGYTAEEVIGKNPRLLKSGRHDANFYAAMWKSIYSTGEWEGEIWNRRKTGEIYPEHLTITAVKGAGGKITNYVATLTDITRSKAAEDEIKHLAFYDPLTKLPNRRLLLDRLRQALASIARSGQTGSLLFIDLDNFKTLNDTLGHDIGDLLLQQVAKRLETCVREGDTVARLGGDEFVIMLENLNKDSIEAAELTEFVGNKILSTLNHPYQLSSYEYHNTPSIGVTLFSDNSLSADDLMKQADIAMYQSKKAGRNTIRFFDPQMQETIDTRATLERELRNALENQQFQLYYQLQVHCIQNEGAPQPIGAEVLIRWNHPMRGLVSPAEFIPLAEELGLILPIGQWVLDTACAQIKAWETDGISQAFVLAVNVSSKQFNQPNFVIQVKETVIRHAINPKQLKLELTESLLLNDIEGTISIMNDLNEVGIQFSLDDFGTGYSSLQYLKRLPLNQIKIDQSFVRDIIFDVNDRAIVKTIIGMALSLNLNYIAEGVETEEQRQLLFDMGCTHYQGYLYGKPMPIEEFEAQLQKL